MQEIAKGLLFEYKEEWWPSQPTIRETNESPMVTEAQTDEEWGSTSTPPLNITKDTESKKGASSHPNFRNAKGLHCSYSSNIGRSLSKKNSAMTIDKNDQQPSGFIIVSVDHQNKQIG